jgi:hypothetical protein
MYTEESNEHHWYLAIQKIPAPALLAILNAVSEVWLPECEADKHILIAG